MNVSGVPAAPVAPPVPAVAKTQATSDASTRPQKQPPEAAAQAAAEAERRAAEKLPPLKPLSTTEMRVILGALPPSLATAKRGSSLRGGSFDAYA